MTATQRNQKTAEFCAQMIAYYMELPADVMTPKDKVLVLLNKLALMLTGEGE